MSSKTRFPYQPVDIISRRALAPVLFYEMLGISTGASAHRLMNRLNQQAARDFGFVVRVCPRRRKMDRCRELNCNS